MGYSPRGCTESDMTEQLRTAQHGEVPGECEQFSQVLAQCQALCGVLGRAFLPSSYNSPKKWASLISIL